MDSRQELKQVITEMMTGNLRKAIIFIDCIKSEQLKSSNKIQLNILITLSQVISKPKLRDKVPISDIRDLIKLCCIKIFNPTESEINNYYRSLYHLLKYLCDKISLKDVTDLCEFIFPDWLHMTDSETDIYELLMHFNILINNNVIIVNLSTQDVDSLIISLKQHLQLLRIIFKRKPVILFQKIRAYCNIFQKSINSHHFPGFCTYFFGLISDLDKLEDIEVATEAYSAFCSVIMVFYDNKNFSNKGYVEETFQKMEYLCKCHKEISDCADIFKLFYSKCVRNIETYDKKDIVEFRDLHEKFEHVLKSYGLSYVVFKTFNYFGDILRSLTTYFEKIGKEIWVNFMTTEIQTGYIKLLPIICKVLKNDKYMDNCNVKCTVKNNFNYAFTISSLSATFLNLSLRYDCNNIEQLNDIAILSIKDCCKYVGQLKQNNCNRWTSNWRLLGTLIYNISTKYYRNQNYKLAKFYLKLFCTQLICLEGTENANLIVENALGTCLNLTANCYSHSQQYRQALTFLAFGILICPEMHDKLWLTWMNVKAKASSSDIGNVFELTIKDILENDIDIFKQFYPNIAFDKYKLEKLLFIELKNYHNMWPSKIPMNNTSKQCFEISDDIYYRTLVLNLSWEKVISLQDEKYIESIENTISLINKKDKGKSLISQVCLSALHFIDFQFKSFDILKKNLVEMNEAVRDEKLILKPFEEPANPNDKFEINPTYFNNKIENNMHLYKILNKSVELWTKILQKDTFKEIKDKLIELNIENMIKKTAFEYRIQNYRYQMVKIWFLYLQFGKLSLSSEIIFTSIGFILEIIDCNSEMGKNIEEKADVYLNDKNISKEAIITYYINKSVGYLRSNSLNKGLEFLNEVEIRLNSMENCPEILKARMLYLKSLYLQKSCEISLLSHGENYIVLAHNAFGMLAEFYKKGGSKCLYALSVLFDISLTIGKLYKSLCMPREIRCYTTESVLLAQQMVLPIRTVQYFSLLALTDLLGFHFQDCRVKISGIDYMLGNQNHFNVKKNTEPIDEKIIEVTKEFDRINISRNDVIETMLDVPVDHRMKNLQGSPILEHKTFTFPSFIYHLDCNCFYCTNLDFSRLVLESTHLEALFYLYQSNVSCSTEFFKGSIRIYKGIVKKYDSKNISSEMTILFKKELLFTYSEMLLDYSTYFAKRQDFDQAIKIIDEIIKLLENDLIQNSYLYSELLYRKINYLSAKENDQIETENTNDNSVDFNVYQVKTPENKISKVSLSVSPYHEPITKRRIKKELKFNLDSDEENEKPVKTKIYKMKTPIKTPAPKTSKIKIYTPSSSRSNKVNPMSLSPKNEKLEPKKSPSNPESKLRTKKVLEKNTKILTEKLKAERKGVLKESNKNSVPEKKAVVKEQNVRQTRRNLDIPDNKKKTVTKSMETMQNVTRRKQYKGGNLPKE